MTRARTLAATAAALALAAAAGCGFGEGDVEEGEAELLVTSDYGHEVLTEATVSDPSESDTVMRVLDDEADLETRFGGAFVQSIDGLAGGTEDDRVVDWFFYVNGIESSSGAADVSVKPGDRIWWDHHDWTDVMRVPAVVGSFPQPLAQESVRLECADAEEACAAAGERLAEADIDFTNEAFEPDGGAGEMRMLVGEWEQLRKDETAALLEQGPQQSGVFAGFSRLGAPPGEWALSVFDASMVMNDEVGAGGLVAALRPGEDPPVWVVTGTDANELDGVVASIEESSLEDRFALARLGGESVPLPVDRTGAE